MRGEMPAWDGTVNLGDWQPFPGSTVTAFGGGFAAPQYRTVNGEVILRGLCSYGAGSSSGSVTLGTLPVGARPPFETMHTVIKSNAAVRLDVNASGAVSLPNGATTSDFVSFDGVRFYL